MEKSCEKPVMILEINGIVRPNASKQVFAVTAIQCVAKALNRQESSLNEDDVAPLIYAIGGIHGDNSPKDFSGRVYARDALKSFTVGHKNFPRDFAQKHKAKINAAMPFIEAAFNEIKKCPGLGNETLLRKLQTKHNNKPKAIQTNAHSDTNTEKTLTATTSGECSAYNKKVIKQFMEVSRRIVKCPHFAECRASCASMDNKPPQPGFIGRNYRGLVIIGANPGLGQGKQIFIENDKEYYRLAEKYTDSEAPEDFDIYINFLAKYMGIWNSHLCNIEFRRRLGYEIEDIAYVNIVKCRTEASSDVFKNAGEPVAKTCAQYLKQQLEILRPKYIIAHWQPVLRGIKHLDIDLGNAKCGAMNGKRNLSYEEKLREITPLFKEFSLAK